MSSPSSIKVPPNQGRKSLQAFGLAIMIEAAIVIVAGIILASNATVKPALSEPVTISLLADQPQPEKPEEPKPLPPPPQVQPKVKTPVKQALPKPQPQQPQQETPPLAEATPVAAAPTAFFEPAPAAPAPPPPATGVPDPNQEYAGKVHAAVQAAHFYPPAAAVIKFSGRVRVEFRLRDAVPSEWRVLVSCGIGMIDRAALQAVQSAHYPEPPADMRGRDNLYQVWVEFTH
jgi:periplasmic protein TonB